MNHCDSVDILPDSEQSIHRMQTRENCSLAHDKHVVTIDNVGIATGRGNVSFRTQRSCVGDTIKSQSGSRHKDSWPRRNGVCVCVCHARYPRTHTHARAHTRTRNDRCRSW